MKRERESFEHYLIGQSAIGTAISAFIASCEFISTYNFNIVVNFVLIALATFLSALVAAVLTDAVIIPLCKRVGRLLDGHPN